MLNDGMVDGSLRMNLNHWSCWLTIFHQIAGLTLHYYWGGMDEWAMSCTELQHWAVVFRAFVFFSTFFGFADETRKNY